MAPEHAELLSSIGGVEAMAAMLRRVRADRVLSPEQLAARIRYPVRLIVRLEAGEVPDPSIATATALARGCEVSVALFVASFALPRGEPLPWPREHLPSRHGQDGPIPGARGLGAMLRELRLSRDWSQRELAARTGVAPTYLSSMERGTVQRPRLLTLTRISHAFASSAPAQVAHLTRLAQAYAGEIDAPPLRRLGRDRLSARDRRS